MRNRVTFSVGRLIVLSSFQIIVLIISALPAHGQFEGFWGPQWRTSGQNADNSRSQPDEFLIGPRDVKQLHVKWSFTTMGNVSATPTVSEGVVFFPDSAGNLFAVKKRSGDLLWSHKISDYTGVAKAITRVSPAVDGHHVFIGDQLGTNIVRSGADLIAVNRETGALEWITQVESHRAAIITGSPVVYDGVVYVGVSSSEEGFAENASYPCCTFRGSIVAVSERTGKVLWKTYTVPDNGEKPGGYSGGSVWSPPAIDARRQTIYVGSANNYTAPADVEACQNADPSKNCSAQDNYFDSVIALDLKTGRIKWGTHLQTYDIWTLACIRPAAPRSNCPVPTSPDFGSGSGPNIIGDTVGIGQKSGIYWSLDADTGRVRWKTQVGPSGTTGGIQWGAATDGKRIYVAIGNNQDQPYTLKPSGEKITWGAWSALDARTGEILWQTADPTKGTSDPGAVSVANDVMYAGSNSGYMYALDAASGKILWSFNSGGSVIDGPSIVDGEVFWGSGYSLLKNNKVYAFSPFDWPRW